MLTSHHTHRDLFRIMYAYARNFNKAHKNLSAHTIADRALDAYFNNHGFGFCDICDATRVSRAVLWAIHWRFKKPMHNDVPIGMSERHLAFALSPLPGGSRRWFERKLP